MEKEKVAEIAEKIIEILVNEQVTICEANDILHETRKEIEKPISDAVRNAYKQMVVSDK